MDDAQLAQELVREAGALASRIRAEGLDVRQKASASDLVTQADTEAERHIVARLRELRPHDAIVGEEGTSHEGTSGRRWVIDPVDGTYNFSRGSDWWCSAVALAAAGPGDQEEVLLGAVHHPATGQTWVGGPDLPSTLDGRPLPQLRETPREGRCAVTYLHPPFHFAEVGEAFSRALDQVGTLRMFGSGTMDAMSIAIGQWDVMFQHSVPDWDRLPGAAIIRGVGGSSVTVAGGGVEWTVSGSADAVADVARALRDR